MKKQAYQWEDLLHVLKRLRSDTGCPWDKKQTHETIKLHAIEEAYELVEAIDNQDNNHMKEELGDLLLQVVFHSQMATEEGQFTMEDVVHGLVEKLIRRHPHVFGNTQVEDLDEVNKQWDDIKKIEKKSQSELDEMKRVSKALPALIYAKKVQKKASRVGLDFEDESQAMAKVLEEWEEVQEAWENENDSQLEEEFGDLLFSIVNLSRFFEINGENALTNATKKFINRFEGIEQMAINQGLSLTDLSAAELDALWEGYKSSQ